MRLEAHLTTIIFDSLNAVLFDMLASRAGKAFILK